MNELESHGDSDHPAMARLMRDPAIAEAVSVLTNRLSGADLTTVLLEVAARRAARRSPADVLRQYESDRFSQPSSLSAAVLSTVESLTLRVASSRFETIELSPVVPLGTHSVVAGVSQNRVVSTMRGSEVAADPTNSLTLEAARRRRLHLAEDPRSSAPVHLAAVQRVVRAQMMSGPRTYPHFSLLGLVSAARDTGNKSFETESLVGHLETLATVCLQAGADHVSIALTDFSGVEGETVDAVIAQLTSRPLEVVVTTNSTRAAGRGYYPSLCFGLQAHVGNEVIDVGDGGVVPWTQRLVGSAKERLMISGLGLDRLTLLT